MYKAYTYIALCKIAYVRLHVRFKAVIQISIKRIGYTCDVTDQVAWSQKVTGVNNINSTCTGVSKKLYTYAYNSS